MSNYARPKFQLAFLHPRYWGTLMLITIMYLLSWLPYAVLHQLGKGVGRIAMHFLKKRKHTIIRNLELCFPDLNDAERQQMMNKNIDNTGLALFETAMAWFWPDWRVKRHVEYDGLEHVYKLKEQNKGAIIIAVHSLNLELGGRTLGLDTQGIAVYRANNNKCYDYFQFNGRVRSNKHLLDRKDVGGMLNALENGEMLWYAPDHDYGKRRRSTFAPLFSVEQACTTTGTSLLADQSRCAVLPFAFVRNCDSGKYVAKIFEPIEDFPYDDPEAAAIVVNKAVERSIMQAPDQYMWLHRRFKTRPEGQPSLY